jgi:hypothetical protein
MAENTDIIKVTMNLSGKTMGDVNTISEITGNTNRTNIIGTAIRVYRKLLEMQEKEKATLLVEDKKGNMKRMELLH